MTKLIQYTLSELISGLFLYDYNLRNLCSINIFGLRCFGFHKHHLCHYRNGVSLPQRCQFECYIISNVQFKVLRVPMVDGTY